MFYSLLYRIFKISPDIINLSLLPKNFRISSILCSWLFEALNRSLIRRNTDRDSPENMSSYDIWRIGFYVSKKTHKAEPRLIL
jgi:hypothetical protein